jgi:hypothetical protein
MPSFYIKSLFAKRKRKYAERIAQARQDLTDFLTKFEAEVGKEVAGVLRAYAAIPRKYFLRDEEQSEAQSVFAEVRRLIRKEARLLRELHSPECFYYERRKPPYVLWCYGIDWDDIQQMLGEDGRLPMEQVLRLLDVLRDGKPSREVVGQERVFRQKRRRLVRFLRMAARLEEDVVCRFR